MHVRLLQPGEERAVEQFLARHANTSLFLLGNLRQAGLADRGQEFHATWAGLFQDGALAGLAAHTWLNTVLLQNPSVTDSTALTAAAARACGRPLKGLLGPRAQVVAAREGLGLAEAPTILDELEILFTLELERLRVPQALAAGRVECRPSADADLDLLLGWRKAYCLETRLATEGPELEDDCRRTVGLAHRQRGLYLLLDGGEPVAMTAFNARLPEVVQVGGVWTPPELRGRGYARCAVAGQLLAARAQGATRAVLFTGTGQHAAQAAYRALGFTEAGDYGLIYFRDPPMLQR